MDPIQSKIGAACTLRGASLGLAQRREEFDRISLIPLVHALGLAEARTEIVIHISGEQTSEYQSEVKSKKLTPVV